MVADYGLSRLALDAVVAHTDPMNHPSIALLRRAGFTEVASKGSSLVFERRNLDADA